MESAGNVACMNSCANKLHMLLVSLCFHSYNLSCYDFFVVKLFSQNCCGFNVYSDLG